MTYAETDCGTKSDRKTRLAAVGEVGEMSNLGTGHFRETTLIRLLVRLGAEPHSPVASSNKSQGPRQ